VVELNGAIEKTDPAPETGLRKRYA
jgi:hypothetical protein